MKHKIKKQVSINKAENVDTIEKTINSIFGYKTKENILIIVDRSCANEDIMYLTTYNAFETLEKVRQNYYIGMDFIVNQQLVKAYLNYGVGSKVRFFTKSLPTILPKLFFQTETFTSTINHYQKMFSLELRDRTFSKMYQKLKKTENKQNIEKKLKKT
eukprot:158197_1